MPPANKTSKREKKSKKQEIPDESSHESEPEVSVNLPTIITMQGYGLPKNRLDPGSLQKIRNELTVSPKGKFLRTKAEKVKKRFLWTEISQQGHVFEQSEKTGLALPKAAPAKASKNKSKGNKLPVDKSCPPLSHSNSGPEDLHLNKETDPNEDGYMYVPKFYGLGMYGPPDIDNLMNEDYFEKYDFVFTGSLRPKQQQVIDQAMSRILSEGGGLIIESCGFGKTVVMCYIACQLGVKTLVLTHTDYLAEQAKNDFKKVSNMKSFGSIVRKDAIVKKKGVVFGSIQSIMNIDNYDRSIFSKFGLILIDEVHHMGAKRYSEILGNISTRYMVGVSATDFREDGLFNVITWYLGDILYRGECIKKRTNAHVVKIFFYCTNPIKTANLKIPRCPKFSNIGGMQKNVALMKRRNRFLFSLLCELIKAGRRVLFISKRKEQIYSIAKKFDRAGMENDYAVLIGTGNDYQSNTLEEAQTKKVVLGIIQKTEEGLNLENLDTLVYGSEIKRPNQSTGRLFRTETYTKSRIVFDIVDVFDPYFLKQSSLRDEFFKLSEYKMHSCSVSTNYLDGQCTVTSNCSMFDNVSAIKSMVDLDTDYLEEYTPS